MNATETKKIATIYQDRDGEFWVSIPSDYEAPDDILAMYTQRTEINGHDAIPANDRQHADEIADAINE